VENLKGKNQYLCSTCNCKRDATKIFSFRRAPNVLVLHLKRFAARKFSVVKQRSSKSDVCTKITTDVQYPETLDFSPYMTDGGDTTSGGRYHLIGIICHHERKLGLVGGMRSGREVYRHYTAYSRATADVDLDSEESEGGSEDSTEHVVAQGDWTCFDDKRCTLVSKREVLSAGSSAYVLFYQRVNSGT
jgi:ubiquitin C-terminal hydrolase